MSDNRPAAIEQQLGSYRALLIRTPAIVHRLAPVFTET